MQELALGLRCHPKYPTVGLVAVEYQGPVHLPEKSQGLVAAKEDQDLPEMRSLVAEALQYTQTLAQAPVLVW